MDTESATNVAPAAGKRARLPRFSLLSFLLAISLVCVAVSHFLVVRDREQLKQKNNQLMNEIGHLVIHDPNKVYIRPLESLDELTWRFRVYLPPAKGFVLNTKANRRSWSGNGIKREDQFTLTIALRKQSSGEWQIKSTMPRQFGYGGADAEIAEKLIKAEIFVMGGDQKEFDPDKPIDLLKYFNGDLHVWITPSEHFQSKPNPKTKKRIQGEF